MIDSGGYARLCDLEPGMWFRERRNRVPLEFAGVDPVVSKFPGKVRVRVLTVQGASWVCDKFERFPLVVEVF